MKNSLAINILFWTWWVFAFVLFAIVGVQSALGKYGDDWSIPSQWAFAMVTPCLTLTTAAWRNKGKPKWQNTPVVMQHFILAIVASSLIWLGTLAIIFFSPLGPLTMFQIIPMTVAAYTLVQAAIIGSVSSIVFANR